MHTITFTSDSGDGSPYLASLKGMLLQRLQERISFVNINNNITHFELPEAAFILKRCYSDFPENTIHMVLMNLPGGSISRLLFSSFKNQHFIVPDLGFFSLLGISKPDKVYALSNIDEIYDKNFSVKERIAEFTAEYLKKKSVPAKYPEIDDYETFPDFYPTRHENSINGKVVYIDHYSNAITNIDQQLFNEVGKGKPFEVKFDRSTVLDSIKNQFIDVKDGAAMCYFDKQGYLVIAIKKGAASSLLRLSKESDVAIYFK